MVGVVVVVAAGIAVTAFALADRQPTVTADVVVEIEETNAGSLLTVERIGQDAVVRVGEDTVATLSADDAGRTVYLPTAPGDRVTVVARGAETEVLVSETVDRGEAGDFIAYYTFEDASAGLVDQSGNGNDGTIQGAPAVVEDAAGTAFQFDGSEDYVEVNGLTTTNVSEVTELTVAVAYRPATADTKQELVEHVNADGSNWLLELKPDGAGPGYDLAYSVDKAGGSQTGQFRVGPYDAGDYRVAVGTFDGQAYELFVDGTSVGSDTFADGQAVGVGDLTIARDGEAGADRDYFDGRIYEVRLYYTALDASEVTTLTERMDED
jgi:hypothetical protein